MAEWALLVVAAPVGAALVIACLREPMSLGLPLFALLVPFGQRLALGSSRYGSLSSLAGFLLLLGLLLQLGRTNRASARLVAVIGVWLAFLGLAALTVVWSVSVENTVSGIVVLGSLICLFLLVALSKVDDVIVRRTEIALLTGALLSVLYGFYQLIVLGGFPSDEPGVGISPDGRFGNDLLGPNNQAAALLLPLAISLSRGVQHRHRLNRLLYLLLSAVFLIGVLMAGSRGGTLAVLVLILVLIMSFPPHGKRRLLGYGAACLAAAVLVWVYHPFGLAQRTGETTSSSGRTDIWQVGLAACHQYCAFGAGWGTFPDVYASTQASVPGARVLIGEGGYQAHNIWLLVIIELGLIGLVLLLIAFSLSIMMALRLSEPSRSYTVAALTATIFAAAFLSNLEFKFFWMMLMLTVLHSNNERSFEPPHSAPRRDLSRPIGDWTVPSTSRGADLSP